MAGRTNGVPGIILFLEIRADLDVRGGGFGHLGCRLAAILGLLAHPVGHLICQAGEHLATCVGESSAGVCSSLSLSLSLTSSFDQTTTSLAYVLDEIERNCHRSPRETGVTTDTKIPCPSSRQRSHELRKRHVHARNSRRAPIATPAPPGLARPARQLPPTIDCTRHATHRVATRCAPPEDSWAVQKSRYNGRCQDEMREMIMRFSVYVIMDVGSPVDRLKSMTEANRLIL